VVDPPGVRDLAMNRAADRLTPCPALTDALSTRPMKTG
jgi:hypothetical protein